MAQRRKMLKPLMAACLLAALSGAAWQARAAEILFYSSVPRNLTDSLTHDFETRNPGITVKTFQAGTETLLQKMELEIKGNGHFAADVVWVQDRSAMERYADKGMFAKYVPVGADKIDPMYQDKQGRWIANFVSFVVLMYNTRAFANSPKPTSWKDLADPKYKNKTMFADPRVSGTGAAVISSFVQNFGWPFVTAIAANQPQIANGHPAMVSTVIAGERTLSPMQDISLYSALQSKQPVAVVFPSEGAIAVPAFAAISASTPQLDASKKFIDYLVSLQAADLLRANGMYHTREDAQPPAGWPPIKTIKTLPFDWAQHQRDKQAIEDRFSDLTER